MAFTMTHLIVSESISKTFASYIKSLPQFYLGSIAPDAVHQRANYTSEYKKNSHLITGDEQWGFITDTDTWRGNVIEFLLRNRHSENHDFILGYCSHVLTDIQNTILVWNPFKIMYADELKEINYGNIHHQENNKLDIELALTYENREEFWVHLANSKSIDLPNIIYATEIDKQKELILYSWYKGKESQDISSNKIRTYEGEMDFIKKASDFVAQIFREYL